VQWRELHAVLAGRPVPLCSGGGSLERHRLAPVIIHARLTAAVCIFVTVIRLAGL
jgi:hypothetical protein